MIGKSARYHRHSSLRPRAGQRPKSAFRQLTIQPVWRSYISSPRPKPRPFLPTTETTGCVGARWEPPSGCPIGGKRARGAAHAAPARRRGDRIAVLFVAVRWDAFGTKQTCRHSLLFFRFRGIVLQNNFARPSARLTLWQKVRRSIGPGSANPAKVTRKKPAKNAMPSASERPFQSFLSLRASEIHWPSGWSLRTSPDQIVWLQISRESVHRLFQARRLLAQSSQCQVLRPLAPRR